MKFPSLKGLLPGWKNALLAVLSAVLLILSFPDFDYWFLAWIAFVPLFLAVAKVRESAAKAFLLGWIFGTAYFTGTVWWLTYSPINYGGFPAPLAYFLLVAVCAYVGLFPALFAGIISVFMRRFGSHALFAAPFVWVCAEFLRYFLSGNSWNAVGYSQSFGGTLLPLAGFGGVYLVSFAVIGLNVCIALIIFRWRNLADSSAALSVRTFSKAILIPVLLFIVLTAVPALLGGGSGQVSTSASQNIIVIQVNVPMSGLTLESWKKLRQRHVEMTETALAELRSDASRSQIPVTVVFPESPMNFMYEDDPEFREFITAFAVRNNINILFNSAEPDAVTDAYFNSAMMVDARGRAVGQYDKIYLVPFGEFVPGPLRTLVPGLIGSFASGREYDLFPLGDAKAGVMLCYESNFGQLSRRLVGDGADVLIEMTNDGYLGKTPVLRQHLTSAVFRAVETNRPVLRATNVGITAYVTPTGKVTDEAPIYGEATKFWQAAKSDGGKTLYVRFGDWIAGLACIVTILMAAFCITGRR